MATDRTKLLLDKLRVWKNEVDKAMDTNRNIKSRYKRVCKVQEEIRSELDGFIKNLADNTCRIVKAYHGRFIETIDYKYYCQTFYNEKDVTSQIYKCLHLFLYGKRYFIEYLKYTYEERAECDKKAHIYGKRSLDDEVGHRIERLSKGGGLVYKISEMKKEKGEYVPFPNWIYYAEGPYRKFYEWRGTFEFLLAVIVTQRGKENDIALWEVLAQAIYLYVALNYEKEDMGWEIEDEDSMGANVTTSVETLKLVEDVEEVPAEDVEEVPAEDVEEKRTHRRAENNAKKKEDKIFTQLALFYFGEAIERGFMEKLADGRYRWIEGGGRKVSLCFFLIRIYGRDTEWSILQDIFGVTLLKESAYDMRKRHYYIKHCTQLNADQKRFYNNNKIYTPQWFLKLAKFFREKKPSTQQN